MHLMDEKHVAKNKPSLLSFVNSMAFKIHTALWFKRNKFFFSKVTGPENGKIPGYSSR